MSKLFKAKPLLQEGVRVIMCGCGCVWVDTIPILVVVAVVLQCDDTSRIGGNSKGGAVVVVVTLGEDVESR